jgi:enoyl-[acyl-carrier protein] reductase I
MANLTNLNGKKGLVAGIANEHSIAYGCAKAFHDAGADLAITYLNEKAEPFVRPLAEGLDSPIIVPCDLRVAGQLEAVYQRISDQWGELDFVLHSIAFAPREDLIRRVVDCSEDGFLLAMRLSCHSFMRMVQLAEPLMPNGGSLLTVTFYGSEKVVADYNLMGPVKAALECAVRYMAAELGPQGIRVNCISPGPIKTRAASGISRFDELLEKSASRAPKRQLATIEEVGATAAFLVGDGARSITGGVHYVDGGYNIIG